jgi:hypothetical protein
MEKGGDKKGADELQNACEKNCKIIRRSRELIASIHRHLSAANSNPRSH